MYCVAGAEVAGGEEAVHTNRCHGRRWRRGSSVVKVKVVRPAEGGREGHFRANKIHVKKWGVLHRLFTL